MPASVIACLASAHSLNSLRASGVQTGHHAAVSAGVTKGDTVAVVWDGAVGLCAVLSARRPGAGNLVRKICYPGGDPGEPVCAAGTGLVPVRRIRFIMRRIPW